MDYHDHMPPQDAAHRQFALCRHRPIGNLDIRRLRVLVRQYPRYIDNLEPGRVLLRHGHRQEAAAWFARFLHAPSAPSLHHELQYLLALALLEDAVEACETQLLRIGADTTSPFRRSALQELAYARLHRRDYPGAVEAALVLHHTFPEDCQLQPIADDICHDLHTLAPSKRAAMLRHIARLPITRLDIDNLALPSLDALHGMALHALFCDNTRIQDLSPLRGMPLTSLRCNENAITSLAALAEIPPSDAGDAPPTRRRCPRGGCHYNGWNVMTMRLPISRRWPASRCHR